MPVLTSLRETLSARETEGTQRIPFAFAYPGNLSYLLISIPLNCGHDSPSKIDEMFCASGCSAFVTSEYSEARKLGASAWTSWNTRHSRLFPCVRVLISNTPLVKSPRSTPVKELFVPVLPPIERRRRSWVPNLSTSSTYL